MTTSSPKTDPVSHQTSHQKQEMKRQVAHVRCPFPSANNKNRHFLPPQIGQKIGYRIEREIKERGEKDGNTKKSSDKDLSVFRFALPQRDRSEPPNPIGHRI